MRKVFGICVFVLGGLVAVSAQTAPLTPHPIKEHITITTTSAFAGGNVNITICSVTTGTTSCGGATIFTNCDTIAVPAGAQSIKDFCSSSGFTPNAFDVSGAINGSSMLPGTVTDNAAGGTVHVGKGK